MGLFKSKEERRIEREMKVRQGLRAIERAIRQQDTFAEDFIRNARHARRIGDQPQYEFIRSALKKTATVKRMLQRQLLVMQNAMVVHQQAESARQFAQSMDAMAAAIGQVLGQTDLTRTQSQWEKALAQAQTLEGRMDLFLDSVQSAPQSAAAPPDQVSDQEIDRMIQADLLAQEKTELGKLDELDQEIARELGAARQKD